MFFGSIPALVTPFSGGRVAEDSLRDLIAWQIDEGSSALVPCGTTGEVATLTAQEHRRVIEIAVEVAAGRVPVIAGCGTYSTAASIERMKLARELGADAALAVVPYYNKPSQEGVYRYFAAVAEATDKPVILYSIPGRCGIEIAARDGLPNAVVAQAWSANLSGRPVRERPRKLTMTVKCRKMCLFWKRCA